MRLTVGEHVASGYGALFGLLLLWVAMTMALNAGQWCPYRECRGFLPSGGASIRVIPISQWKPFVDDPGEFPVPAAAEPHCPSPAVGSSVVLAEAPLPEGFDPTADQGRPLFACVRLSESGRVIEARLLGSTNMPGVDKRLTKGIKRTWRFRADNSPIDSARWHRVRLNKGPVGGSFPAFYLE
ncbi:hypothetical protein E2493_00615 [Sphingomonas parva]|uniref:Uncharacterized protein n=1 Tax=Sphingomonas parva TaxID=2555898 RepID=A0A4Y8ZYY3_9SPHN|nr:hypothetical protein [Sphingomonas parva]TFI60249.1 hypothetical protein E2493_00615 [Sphingomonas parva]